MKLNELTIEQAHTGLQKKEFTSREITEACLSQIKKINQKLGAYLTVTEESALEQADEADELIKKGKISVLTGVPLAIKDNIQVDGVGLTCGSKILEHYLATYDAEVIRKLKLEHTVFLGKTNLDEFAMGSSTENSALATTKNPWDTSRVPGGSSGGSAVAVAADLCLGALGSDTGCSVRQPASFCGVVGLKPTYGRVSRHGLVAMTSSLDQIGTLTKNVRDNALLFQSICGLDKNDSTTIDRPNIDLKKIDLGVKGLTIGVPQEYFVEGMEDGVRKSIEAAINDLKKSGARIVKVELPLTKYALAVYYLTAVSEISANLARFDGIRYGLSTTTDKSVKNLMEVYLTSKEKGLGDEVKRRIIMGTFALSAGYYNQYYLKAQKLRVLISREFANIFKKVDCLITPTSPSVAFKFGEKYSDPLMMYLSDIYTCPANLGGICGISVPCGSVGGLPVGLQVLAKPFDEEMLFRVAYQYEQTADWHTKKPKL